jgi:hypothetical protein
MDIRKSLLYKLSKDVLINLIVKENINEVYVLYYNSESSGDDGIESVHRTLEGAVEKAKSLYREMYKDEPDYVMDNELENKPSSTKGVNSRKGWSFGTYNIYPVSFEN